MPRKTACVVATGCALVLFCFGLALIYSATHRSFGSRLLVRQALYFVPAVVLVVGLAVTPRRRLMRHRWWIYGAGLVLLVITLFVGTYVRGQISWIDVGLFRIQTSEVMKPLLVLVLADLTTKVQMGTYRRGLGLVLIGTTVLVPVAVIMIQGDTGTSLLYIAFLGGWMFLGGFWREAFAGIGILGGGVLGVFGSVFAPGFLRDLMTPLLRVLEGGPGMVVLGTVLLGLGLGTMASYVVSHRLHGLLIPGAALGGILAGVGVVPHLAAHHIRRIEVFFDPYQAPFDTGYNIIQSQIALGSGGLWGQGYLQGSQSQLGFIPELWTDFIFTVAVEELGLVTGLLIVGLIFLMVYSLFSTAVLAPDWRSYYLCAGAALFIALHAAANLGVTVGVLPVMGVPLLFVSYGGSALLMASAMLGLTWMTLHRLPWQAFWRKNPGQARSVLEIEGSP